MATSTSPANATALSNKFPTQIKYIVGNEICERFSFYGMKAILVVFMTDYLMKSNADAKTDYHLFVQWCYFLPLLGDRPAVTEREKAPSILSRIFAGSSSAPGRDQVLLLPGSVSRQIAQAKADPFTHRYTNLARLPVMARRGPE